MKIQITRPIIVRNHPGVKVGDVIETDFATAAQLTGLGAALPWVEPIQTREPVVENRDPVISETPLRKSSLRRRPK